MSSTPDTHKLAMAGYGARDATSILDQMKEMIPGLLPEWKDFDNEADFGNVLLQLFAHMGDMLSYYQDAVARESFLPTAQLRSSIVRHLELIGYQMKTAVPARVDLTVSVPVEYDKPIVIARGDRFATSHAPMVHFVCERTSTFAKEESGAFTFPVAQGRLIEDELIGTADDAPNALFPLSQPDVVVVPVGQWSDGDVRVTTTSTPDGLPTDWRRKQSFAFSQSASRDFVVETDADGVVAVRFGDGAFGQKPASGDEIRATYWVGGGQDGNVPPVSITAIVSSKGLKEAIEADPEIKLDGNKFGASGGAAAESTAAAVHRAPQVFRSKGRAVTLGDYEALALDYPGVEKVLAQQTSWNTVSLYIAPKGGGPHNPVSDDLRAGLLEYLAARRPAATKIDISRKSLFVPVLIRATMYADAYYTPEAVQGAVADAVANLLALPLVDFGQVLYISQFYEVIDEVPGVTGLHIRTFSTSAGDKTVDGIMKLRQQEIPYLDSNSEFDVHDGQSPK